MHTLITGGAGFIGSHLAERLLSDGDRISIVDNLSTGRRSNIESLLQNCRCELIEGSVLDKCLMDRVIAGCDRVFHLAAAVGVHLIIEQPVQTIETNIHGSEVVLGAAARHCKMTLLASSSEVYGKATKIPFCEDDDVVYGNTNQSRWSYAISKAADEFLALAYHRQLGLPVVIARLFNTIGTRQSGTYGMVTPRLVESALAGRPLHVYGNGKQTRCFADVYDVITAMLKIMDEPSAVGQIFNVGADVPVSIEQMARRIIELTDSTSMIEFVPYDQAYALGFEDLRVRQPSLAKIKAATDYEPSVTLDQTLLRVIEWMRGEGITDR